MSKQQWIGIERGDTFKVTADEDGYPAVQITNRVWAGEEDRWITVSATDYDQQRNVRDLAATLLQLADAMDKLNASRAT